MPELPVKISPDVGLPAVRRPRATPESYGAERFRGLQNFGATLMQAHAQQQELHRQITKAEQDAQADEVLSRLTLDIDAVEHELKQTADHTSYVKQREERVSELKRQAEERVGNLTTKRAAGSRTE